MLDSIAAVERLVASYVAQHNTVMLHRASDRGTPYEVYFGVTANVVKEPPTSTSCETIAGSQQPGEDVRYVRTARYGNRGGTKRSRVSPNDCICVGDGVGGPDPDQG